MMLPDREAIIKTIDEAVSNGAGLARACDSIYLGERRLLRWRQGIADGRRGGNRGASQAFTELEKDEVVALFEREDLKSVSVRVAYAKLLDENVYLGSPASIYRILNSRKVSRSHIRQHKRKRPELIATGKNQIWCWDITYLPTQVNGVYFFLYTVLDLYSRKIVGWCIQAKEDGNLARQMIAEALMEANPTVAKLILHSDNGAPMKHKGLRKFCEKAGIQQSYSRPHTSNDNAFIESHFSTMKSRNSYPEMFSNLESAEFWVDQFVKWYNGEHLHQSLDWLTPQSVYDGNGNAIQAKRNERMKIARDAFPSRFGSRKKIFKQPTETRLKHRVQMANPTGQGKEEEQGKTKSFSNSENGVAVVS
jgi:putative transposase